MSLSKYFCTTFGVNALLGASKFHAEIKQKKHQDHFWKMRIDSGHVCCFSH